MRRVQCDVVIHQQSNARVERTCEGTQSTPKQSVMNDQEIGTAIRGAPNGALRAIHGRGDACDRPVVLNLHTVQGWRIVWRLGGAEQRIELPGDGVQRNTGHGSGGMTNRSASMVARMESTRSVTSRGIAFGSDGFGTHRTTSVLVSS